MQEKSNEKLTLDSFSYGSIHVIGKGSKVSVGKFTSIASGVIVLSVGHNPSNVSTFPFNHKLFNSNFPRAINSKFHPVSYGNVTIGNDVWIGHEVLIMGGVNISDGSIIAARSIVTKDTEPYSINAGIPASTTRYRFSAEIIQRLLIIKWWEWPIEEIRLAANLLCSPNIEGFINYCRKEGKII